MNINIFFYKKVLRKCSFFTCSWDEGKNENVIDLYSWNGKNIQYLAAYLNLYAEYIYCKMKEIRSDSICLAKCLNGTSHFLEQRKPKFSHQVSLLCFQCHKSIKDNGQLSPNERFNPPGLIQHLDLDML